MNKCNNGQNLEPTVGYCFLNGDLMISIGFVISIDGAFRVMFYAY